MRYSLSLIRRAAFAAGLLLCLVGCAGVYTTAPAPTPFYGGDGLAYGGAGFYRGGVRCGLGKLRLLPQRLRRIGLLAQWFRKRHRLEGQPRFVEQWIGKH